jgi:uncharacterized 2Fe-2S/4Fe-4S cluster protein (DUF4445 family)
MPEYAKGESIVVFQPSGRRGYVGNGRTIKQASEELGVDIEGLCGEGATCGKCKVRIEEGSFNEYGIESRLRNLSEINSAEKNLLSPEEQESGYRLACQAKIQGDIIVFVPEESRLGKQVIRKTPKALKIEPKPAVKKYYLEMSPATLDDTLGDWERLQKELGEKFDLPRLEIDYRVLMYLQEVVRQGDWKVTASVWMNREVIRVEAGRSEKAYGLAIDVGTTTVAGYLYDLGGGTLLATESMMNPQVVYGEDVMSRVTYCMNNEGGLEHMNLAITKGVSEIAVRAAAKAQIKQQDIIDMTVVGNTCMHHLLLNLDPLHIAGSPFTPAIHQSLDIKARDLQIDISPGAYIHVLPIEAGFVGADNVGVLIAEAPYNQDSMALITDIGTNGELIMGNRHGLISSSCATGPAFEGAGIKFGMRAAPGAIERIEIDRESLEPRFKVIGKEAWNTELEDAEAKGICGSGIVDGVAQLFMAGIIDHTGRFRSDVATPRLRSTKMGAEFVIAWASETSTNQDITICQGDVRNIQLAKGAMYAGAKIMMRRLGIKKLDKVTLAGAFGSYINKASAAVLGLFPDCDLEHIYSVGNAAGDGASMALLNTDKRIEADTMARQVEYIELTLEPDFQNIFAQAMWLPHMKDDFPHITHILPAKKPREGHKIIR